MKLLHLRSIFNLKIKYSWIPLCCFGLRLPLLCILPLCRCYVIHVSPCQARLGYINAKQSNYSHGSYSNFRLCTKSIYNIFSIKTSVTCALWAILWTATIFFLLHWNSTIAQKRGEADLVTRAALSLKYNHHLSPRLSIMHCVSTHCVLGKTNALRGLW